jgi:hypothetical protein
MSMAVLPSARTGRLRGRKSSNAIDPSAQAQLFHDLPENARQRASPADDFYAPLDRRRCWLMKLLTALTQAGGGGG